MIYALACRFFASHVAMQKMPTTTSTSGTMKFTALNPTSKALEPPDCIVRRMNPREANPTQTRPIINLISQLLSNVILATDRTVCQGV
jgi:hypothetical protein